MINSVLRYYLVHFFQPSIQTIEWPSVGDIINQQDTLSASRIGTDDGAESALAGSVPQLQFYPFAVQ